MKKFLILLFISQFAIVFAQKNVKMYYEQKQDTIAYYVDNLEIYPTSIVFASQPELENMKKPELFKTTQVFPAKSTRNRVTYFVANDKKKRWGIKKMPSYVKLIGDITVKNYDNTYVYDLPIKKGNLFKCIKATTVHFLTKTKTL